MYHNFIKSLCHLIRLGFTYKSVLAIISFYQDASVSLLIYYKFCVFAFHFNARKRIQTFFKHGVNSVNQLFMIFLKHTLASQSLWLWSLVFHKVLRRPAPRWSSFLFVFARVFARKNATRGRRATVNGFILFPAFFPSKRFKFVQTNRRVFQLSQFSCFGGKLSARLVRWPQVPAHTLKLTLLSNKITTM